MKVITLRGYTNTIILVAILVLNALYDSELGGNGTQYNTISFILAVVFISMNLRFNPFLTLAFAFPLIFLFSSVTVNAATLHAGGFNSALAVSAGYALLTLKQPPLDCRLMKRLVLVYLIAGLTLSLHRYSKFLSTGDVIGLVANKNFNLNPNAASLFFFTCLTLALVFVRGWLMLVLVTAFSVLVLTTGSRAGFVSTAILLVGFTLYGRTNSRSFNWFRTLLSKKTYRNILILVTVLAAVYILLPSSFSYLQLRLSSVGLDLAAQEGGGRDEIWKAIFDVSQRSLTTTLFGTGPATASMITDQGSHSSYVEAIGSVGWPFLIFTLFAVLCLFHYHKGHAQKEFLLFGSTILIYGTSSTELFNGLNSIWWVFIFLSLYYRSIGSDQALPKEKYVNSRR